MAEITLKACPFCGTNDISIKTDTYHGGALPLHGEIFSYVECMDCDIKTSYCFDADAIYSGFETGKDVAIAIWNTRVI